jgi:hypothetical protein
MKKLNIIFDAILLLISMWGSYYFLQNQGTLFSYYLLMLVLLSLTFLRIHIKNWSWRIIGIYGVSVLLFTDWKLINVLYQTDTINGAPFFLLTMINLATLLLIYRAFAGSKYSVAKAD